MRTLEEIQDHLAIGDYDLSRHALHRIVERNIAAYEIREAGTHAEMIEEYPDDKYSPSGLILGSTNAGRPLHLQVTLSWKDRPKVITLYEPDPDEWIDGRIRR